MDAALVGQAGAAERAIMKILPGTPVNRFLIRSLRKEPFLGPMHPVPLAQFGQQIITQGHDALATALGMGDAQLMSGRIDVSDTHARGWLRKVADHSGRQS